MITVIIPMAGQGSRFIEAGYTSPKPLIKVANKTLAEHSITSLGIDGKYIFITRDFDDAKDNELLTQIFHDNCKDFVEVRVNEKHLGAAHSSLFAEKYVDPDSELIITNCDQILQWDAESFFKKVYDTAADGAVVVYDSNNPKNSFAKIVDDRVVEIAEKRPISRDALVGVHYWKKASDFFSSAKQLMNNYLELDYKEPYISLSYNYLSKEKLIIPFKVDDFMYTSLGTPEDVNKYYNISDRTDFFMGLTKLDCTYSSMYQCPYKDDIEYTVITDVEIKNKDAQKATQLAFQIDSAFILHATEPSFYHGLIDHVGQFLFIKHKIDSDTVPIYFENEGGVIVKHAKDFMQEMLTKSPEFTLFAVPEEFGSIKIKNLYALAPIENHIMAKLFLQDIRKMIGRYSYNDKSQIMPILRELTNYINLHIKDKADKIKDKKIFIHSSNNKMTDEEILKENSEQRFFFKKDYDKIVKAFMKSGFDIVDPEGLSFKDQVNLFSSASHIASTKSSNSVHSLYLDPDVKFIIVSPGDDYEFPHEKMISWFIDDVTVINSVSEINKTLKSL